MTRLQLPHQLPAGISRQIGETLGRFGISPNLLTLVGLAGAAGAATLVAYGHFWQAGLAMLGAGAFDLLDGAVARATGQDSTFGAILDAVSDRLAEVAMLIGLLVWFTAPERFDREATILIAATISGSLLVSYTRSKAGEYGVDSGEVIEVERHREQGQDEGHCDNGLQVGWADEFRFLVLGHA